MSNKPPVTRIQLLVKIANLEAQIFRSAAKLDRALCHHASQTAPKAIKGQARRLKFLGTAQEELVALRAQIE